MSTVWGSNWGSIFTDGLSNRREANVASRSHRLRIGIRLGNRPRRLREPEVVHQRGDANTPVRSAARRRTLMAVPMDFMLSPDKPRQPVKRQWVF